MFAVYWIDHAGSDPEPQCRLFDKDGMAAALLFTEQLRIAQRNGERRIGFITLCSENPDAVGKAGAADPGVGYTWTKRRGNRPRAKRELAPGDFEDH